MAVHRAAVYRGLMASLLLACVCSASAQGAAGSDWADYNQARMQTAVGTKSFGSSLKSVLEYSFSTPLARVQTAVVSPPSSRLRRVLNDAMQGKQIKVVAVGGPATNGSAASNPAASDYVTIYTTYLARAFPGAKITVDRRPVGMAPSSVVAGCASNYLPDDADLVLLEMTANDAPILEPSIDKSQLAMAYETLVRQALSGSKQPALVLTQTMVPGAGNGATPFYLTPETPHYTAVASYYGVPMVSMRNALWDPKQTTPEGFAKIAAVSQEDGATPLDAGHKAIADALVFYTQRTAEDLQVMPYGDWDNGVLAEDKPGNLMYAQMRDNQDKVLANVSCNWARQVGGNNCPSSINGFCGLNYTTKQAFVNSAGSAGSEGLSRGAIVGIVVAIVVVVLLALAGLLAFCIIRKRRQQAEVYKQTLPVKSADVPVIQSDGMAQASNGEYAPSGKVSTAVPVTADTRPR